MKIFSRHILINCLITLSFFTACRKKDNADPRPAPAATGAVRPVGPAMGNILSKQIGPEGGTIATQHGSISVTIPAGALATPVTIGLQPVQNTNPGALGTAYRLTPHGITLQKPVSISFSYPGGIEKTGYTSALGLSFQDEKGVWQYVTDPVINLGNKTVTVTTTHFSDWALMQWLFITPAVAEPDVNEKVTLKVVKVLPLTERNGAVVPALPKQGNTIPVMEESVLDSKYIEKWELNGEGALAPDGANAEYTAPATFPAPHPIAVTAKLNLKNITTNLVTYVQVNGDFVSVRVNEGEWLSLPASIIQEGAFTMVRARAAGQDFDLQFANGTGLHQYSETTYLEWTDEAAGFVYRSIYVFGFEGFNSGGGVDVTSMGGDGYITGSFTVVPSGMFNRETNKQAARVNIEGKFRIKKI